MQRLLHVFLLRQHLQNILEAFGWDATRAVMVNARHQQQFGLASVDMVLLSTHHSGHQMHSLSLNEQNKKYYSDLYIFNCHSHVKCEKQC